MPGKPRREPHFLTPICHISPPTDPICVIFTWIVYISIKDIIATKMRQNGAVVGQVPHFGPFSLEIISKRDVKKGGKPEGADWAKKKGVFKMWIEHGPQSLLGLWLAPRGRPCSEFLFAPELEPSNLRGPCLILRGVDPTFHHKIFTADHPLHQMAYFCVVWCCCNKQIWLQKKLSEKMKCVVMWLNMCCLS